MIWAGTAWRLLLPRRKMSSLLRKISKRFSRILTFRLALLGLFLIGATSASANSIPLQVQSSETDSAFRTAGAPTDLLDASQDAGQFFVSASAAGMGRDLFASRESKGTGASFSIASPTDIRLSGYQTQVVPSAPGSTVTLNLQNFVLSGHSTLTLLGDATATFIINVTKQFSLAQSAKIVLSGGIQWNHVLFNVLGTGSVVSLSGKSSLFGALTASQRTVRLNGHAIVYGAVLARQLVIRQAAQVIPLPIVSQ